MKNYFPVLLLFPLIFQLLSCDKDLSPLSEGRYLLCEYAVSSTSELLYGDTTKFPQLDCYMPPNYSVTYDKVKNELTIRNIDIDFNKNLKVLFLNRTYSDTYIDNYSFQTLTPIYSIETNIGVGFIEHIDILPDNSVNLKLSFEDIVRNISINEEENTFYTRDAEVVQIDGDTAKIRINSVVSLNNYGFIPSRNIIVK